MKLKYIAGLLLVFTFAQSYSQKNDSTAAKTIFDKKLYIGGTFSNTWSTIKGNGALPKMFTKPSLGGFLKAEYYPISFLGLAVGFGYQQRGAGIKTPDYDMSLGNPDSTNRLRLRFNCFELPLMLVARTPKDIFDGVRLSGGIGVIPSFNVQTRTVFHSVEDGFHNENDISGTMYKNDMLLGAALGLDINAAESCVFKVQVVYQQGTKNVFKDATLYPGYSGKNNTIGIQLSWLY